MVGNAPFEGLGDLGIDMRLGEHLGMPPADAGLERATEEMVAELLSSSEGGGSDGMGNDEARAALRTRSPTVAKLFDEGDQALEEERVAEERGMAEMRETHSAAEVTVAYSAWEHYIDRAVGPAPVFNYDVYLREHPYAPPARTLGMYRRAKPSDWPTNAKARRSSVIEAELADQRVRWKVPSDVHLFVPGEYERPDQPPPGMVVVNYHMMEAGFQFPLHHNLTHLLAAWKVAPIQIHPNGWLNILSLFTWVGKHRLYRFSTPAEDNFIFTLSESKELYIRTWQGGTFFKGIPSKLRDWQKRWFFVVGSWKLFGIN